MCIVSPFEFGCGRKRRGSNGTNYCRMRVSTIIIDYSILGERGLSRFTWKWARSQFS